MKSAFRTVYNPMNRVFPALRKFGRAPKLFSRAPTTNPERLRQKKKSVIKKKKAVIHGAIQLNGVLSPHRRLQGSSCLEGASRIPPPEPIIEQRLLQACQFREDVGLNLRFEQATMQRFSNKSGFQSFQKKKNVLQYSIQN